jgi:hypothetical protein
VGTNAVIYWNKGDVESLAKLKKYCEADVTITRALYVYGVKNNHLTYMYKWNEIKEMKLDFSYPKVIQPDSNQFSLF